MTDHVLLKLTTDRYEASRGLSATGELLVIRAVGSLKLAIQSTSQLLSVYIKYTVSYLSFECRSPRKRILVEVDVVAMFSEFQHQWKLGGCGDELVKAPWRRVGAADS